MIADDWYRHRTWSEEIAAEFERRLARARSSRGQYLHIQGGILASSETGDLRKVGRQLLRRYIGEYPDDLFVRSSYETIGASYLLDGRLSDSEQALRTSVALCEASPIGYSGTSGFPDVRLAEVLIAMGGRAVEAAGILDAANDRVLESPMVVTRYRFFLLFARAMNELDGCRATELAQVALELADQTTPVFRRHPTVGVPDATLEEIGELRRIARRPDA